MAATRRHHFDLNDAVGLVRNSSVKMAGVRVGIIDRIELVDGKARVFLVIDEDIPITSTTKIEISHRGDPWRQACGNCKMIIISNMEKF